MKREHNNEQEPQQTRQQDELNEETLDEVNGGILIGLLKPAIAQGIIVQGGLGEKNGIIVIGGKSIHPGGVN